MRRLILIVMVILLLACVNAAPVELKGFVNDYADIISPDYETQIGAVVKEIYDSKTAEFTIVTIKSLDGKDIESYSLEIAQDKLGDKEKNNGLLLLVSLDDRKYRFEVGRGLEPIFNDARIGRIARDYIVENFKNNDYGKGILEASYAVKSVLLGNVEDDYYVDDGTIVGSESLSTPFIVLSILFFIFVIGIAILRWVLIFKAGKRLLDPKVKDKYFDAALMAGLLFGGRGRGGLGGGGFGGGGFGGFGGGGFGGGGASGGW
ncbi:MAG: TPM domain-containing protein [Nanoarchaeota archaeon]